MSVVLLIGDRHSGKTTACQRLADAVRAHGLTVAGVLAPAMAGDVGYMVVDLADGRTTRLATIDGPGVEQVGRFHFTAEGLAVGRAALTRAVEQPAALTIVDEVGPLELAGGGWAQHLDPLASGPTLALFTLRRELVARVTERWPVPPARILHAPAGTATIVAAVLASLATWRAASARVVGG